jgi:hypothetical protein
MIFADGGRDAPAGIDLADAVHADHMAFPPPAEEFL